MKQWEKQRNSSATEEPVIRKELPEDPFEGFIKQDEDGLFLVDPSKLKTEEDYKKATEMFATSYKENALRGKIRVIT